MSKAIEHLFKPVGGDSSTWSRENPKLKWQSETKMAAFAVACCCLAAVATALLCAVNSVQPGPYMVRTGMAPLICVCTLIV